MVGREYVATVIKTERVHRLVDLAKQCPKEMNVKKYR